MSESDLDRLSPAITRIIVLKSSCNYGFDALDLSRFDGLKEVKVGDECFKNVTTVNITGLSQLESVEIGVNSFTQHKNGWGNDPSRHFYLKNCPKLKSLKMGRYSFSDYTVIEIENVDALEEIEIGELDDLSGNFYVASLKLESVIAHTVLGVDMPSLQSLKLGDSAFMCCDRVVFESGISLFV